MEALGSASPPALSATGRVRRGEAACQPRGPGAPEDIPARSGRSGSRPPSCTGSRRRGSFSSSGRSSAAADGRTGDDPGPAAGAVLFAVHPLATEAVIAHASFPAILAVTFAVGALLAARGGTGGSFPAVRGAGPLFRALLCECLALADRPRRRGARGARGRGGGRITSPLLAPRCRPFAVALLLYYACWVARAWPNLLSSRRTGRGRSRRDRLPGGCAPDGGSAPPGPVDPERGSRRPAFLGSWNFRAVGGAATLAVLLVAAVALGSGRKKTLPVVA